MNKIAKRLVAGASAAALLVSAVGVDQLADLFTKTSYAASGSGKFAQSTGFNNLEQDTTTGNDKYNTGYGLHTNKTAKEVGSDGRTFDVDLESWYVGENPVDVATILDASGSMAWTVDTLKPLELDATSMGIDDIDTFAYEYGIDEDDLAKYTEYDNKLTKVLAAIQDKDENGGYLPQEIVDKILKPEKTDNSKLSYAGYKYYVYENRSSVSEFVPLGYWNGGKTAEKFEPIGYYPFNGSLANSMGGTATYIKQAATGGEFDKNSTATITPQAAFSGSYLDLSKTDKNGNIVIDLSNQLDVNEDITISFTLKCDQLSSDKVPQSPIFYLGDGTNTNYLSLMRGRCNDNGTSASNHLYLSYYDKSTSASTNLNVPGTSKGDNSAIYKKNSYDYYGKETSGSLTISKTGSGYEITLVFGSNTFTYSGNDLFNFSSDKLYFVLGGDEILPKGSLLGGKDDTKTQNVIDPDNLKGNYIKNVKITGTSKDSTTTYEETFELKDADGLTGNKGTVAKYCEQGDIGDASLSLTEQVSKDAEPEYKDNALDLIETGKNGAILLDAMPNSDNYTLSFKMKIKKGSANPTKNQNIIYVGDGSQDTNKYQSIYRRDGSSSSHIGILDYNRLKLSQYLNGGTSYDDEWATITVTVKGKTAKVYVDGKQEYKSEHSKNNDSCYWETDNLTELNAEQMKIILAGLWDPDTYKNAGEIYLDEVYVFDKALDAGQVAAVAKATEGQTEFAILPSALSGSGTCGGYHATMKDTDVDIAQISERLAQNPNDEERKGWYYVNSHSKWADIEGCLESGKQYIGIYDKASSEKNEDGIENVDDAGKDTATIPSAYNNEDNDVYKSIKAGDTNDKKFNKAPDNERSIRFYVDSQNHLRCFAWSGSTSKDGDIRTFCSLVYEKGYNDDNSEQITKYEELNNALNTFYQKIAEKSDLSNNAVVRFSTNSAINTDNTTGTEKTKENLKKLIMKDWTNWSDFYQKYKEDNSGAEPKTTDYLQNLLQAGEKSSTDTTKSSHGIDEYPYVMTGGTYTWTGLKAFYDNMVKNEDSQTAKDIANDARDKYLIIFTDGRDNTQDYDVSDKTATDTSTKLAGSPDYDTGSTFGGTKYVGTYNPYAGKTHNVGFSIKNYGNNWGSSGPDPDNQVQKFVTGDHEIKYDGDLAEAWADKLKDEGYTIYCVMMASGSISPTANEAEYNKAKNFLKSLSGSNELDAQIAQMQNAIDYGNKPDVIASKQQAIEDLRDDYVIVVDPTVKDSITVTDAFQQILEDIQLPRNDYTVQDYIDPRFDLVDADGNLYKLGAGGKITVTKDGEAVTGLKYSDGSTFTNGNAVGNIIDSIDNGTTVKGLAYTPMESYMVNRKADSSYDDGYNTGDGFGTGYIYYDDVKDMYYLRWTDQIIPMENEAFDTATDHKNLDVWSATIRLKAKDDFIGGNNILTNGNEAGENLVYSDATIDNMTDNPDLYGLKAGSTYREKLAVLSGTDRKINAVDAGGVSQAVYGNGIDIPSSGFPRTTVNVRLLKLDAKNLNDVIYMGEVVSPTMMLADLENGYMTGSYYLQYLERYAYRLYGEDADSMPLIELLNKWLKIDDKNEASKTFTIPYIYLPDPEYNSNGTLAKVEGSDKVKLQNSTGWDSANQGKNPKFDDLNLRDVTGFITYTWKRDDHSIEEQQKMEETDAEGNALYDITKDYVVKNTNQIVYNLQLKFTPLKETADELDGFTLDPYFIIADPTAGTGGDKFFNIVSGEFAEMTTDGKWTTDYGREDYLQAMIQETRTYEPHVMYDITNNKWKLIEEADKTTALETYEKDDQTTVDKVKGTVTDSGVYDWDKEYKPVAGIEQIEGDKLTDYYTSTPHNVGMADKDGVTITKENGDFKDGYGKDDVYSLVANTTYTKDVVNAALALELFVDGKYLNQGLADTIKDADGLSYTFDAVRYYDDPIDPPPYDKDASIGADTLVAGQKYQLTFKVDPESLPKSPQSDTIYKVWATLDSVAVWDSTSNKYILIDTETDDSSVTGDIKSYVGYAAKDALPIGTYEIKTEPDTDNTKLNSLKNDQFKIGEDLGADVNFKYLKIENDKQSYAYDKFPSSVYTESDTAADITKDGDYLIWNKDTNTDRSKANIAESNREKEADTYTLTFNFGTDDTKNKGAKGVSKKDDPDTKDDYAKDRLGIIMLSADNNSLAVTKEVTNTTTSTQKYEEENWTFTVTIKTDDEDWINEHKAPDNIIKYDLYTRAASGGDWTLNPVNENKEATFEQTTDGTTHTLTVKIELKHNQKALLKDLPDGDWQVTEVEKSGVLYTPHNNANGLGEDEWLYQNSNKTNEYTLTPISQVDFVNEFPYELPSTGGSGTVRYLLIGTALISVGAMLFAVLFFDRRKKARK